MFFRQSRKLTIPLFFLAALLLVVLLVGIASAEEFTPAMIRRFSPAVKLLLTDDGKDNFGQGTGFFISPDGHMLTNYHVVEDSKKIVIFEDEKVYEVKRVIDFNEEADVALLETDYPRSKIHYLPLRTTLIEMGEAIMVLGYPKATELGTEITSTKGNVSSIRSAGVNALVQFTAPVAGGSSGSPIIDTNGEVAGIVTSELTLGQGMFLGLSSPSIARHVGRHIPSGRVAVSPPRPQAPSPTPPKPAIPQSPPIPTPPEAVSGQGDSEDNFNMGYDMGVRFRDTQNYAVAAKFFHLAAEQGFARAQSDLGLMYVYGQGVPQNYSEAVKLFRLAAEQGLDGAQFNLGLMYDIGQGVPQNYSEAAKWYRLAAEQGHEEAQSNLGVMFRTGQGVPQNYSEAARWFHLAAEQGLVVAQYNLGLMYAGGQGVPQNYSEAARLFRMAAEQGHDGAQFSLGLMYAGGQGVPQNYSEAARWFRLAAEQGHLKAQYSTGVLHRDGQGVPQNYSEAAKWFRLAAEQGYGDAQSNLGLMFSEGQGVPQNYSEAARLFRMAAEQGNERAQLGLGLVYANGDGVPKNLKTAYIWFSISAANSSGDLHKVAVENRDKAARFLTKRQLNECQKIASEWKPKN